MITAKEIKKITEENAYKKSAINEVEHIEWWIKSEARMGNLQTDWRPPDGLTKSDVKSIVKLLETNGFKVTEDENVLGLKLGYRINW